MEVYNNYTYLTSTCAICCPMRKKEGNIRSNLTRPFLELLFSSKATTELICCPQRGCSIATPTAKPSTSWYPFIKMNLPQNDEGQNEGQFRDEQ